MYIGQLLLDNYAHYAIRQWPCYCTFSVIQGLQDVVHHRKESTCFRRVTYYLGLQHHFVSKLRIRLVRIVRFVLYPIASTAIKSQLDGGGGGRDEKI